MAFPSERRRLLLGLWAELGEQWITFAELTDLIGVDGKSGPGRAVEGMLNRMRRAREVERREITEDEIYDRGVAPSTAYLWRIAQADNRGRGRIRAAVDDDVGRRATALRDLG